jgi:hypothetical protein
MRHGTGNNATPATHTQKKKTGYVIRWAVSSDARNPMVVKINGVTCTSANLCCHFAAELGCSRFPHAPHHCRWEHASPSRRNVEMGFGQIRKMCGRDELGMRSSDLTPPIIVISLVGRAYHTPSTRNYQPESPPPHIPFSNKPRCEPQPL